MRDGGVFLLLVVPATMLAVAVGLARGVRKAPEQFVKDYPDGPVRASWNELRQPFETRWLQRLNIYGRLLARAPERLYPLFALAFAGLVGWITVLWVGAVLTGWPRGFGVALTALIVLIGLSAGVGLYQLAISRTRQVLSAAVHRWAMPDRAFACGLAIYCPTFAFAAATTMLVRYDLLTVDGARPSDSDLTQQAFAAYLWYLADAIPVLKVPATLNWTPALQFPTWQGGSLALLYKLMLILPVVHLVTFGLSQLWGAQHAGAEAGGDDDAGQPEPSREDRSDTTSGAMADDSR